MASLRSKPDGWYYEEPDPTVGIFGEGWVHEACPTSDDDPFWCGECTVDTVRTERIDSNTVRNFELVTCQDCGAKIEVSWDDWDPDDQTLAQLEREWDGLNELEGA